MPDPISMLYDAAIGEMSWEDALKEISKELQDASLSLAIGDPASKRALEFFGANMDTSVFWSNGVNRDASFHPEQNILLEPVLAMPLNRIVDRRLMLPDEQFYNNHFIQKTLISQDVTNFCLFSAARSKNFLVVGLLGGRGAQSIPEDGSRRFEGLIPHFGRAMRLRAQLDRNRSKARNLACLLEDLSYGVMLLDRQGEVVLMNARCDSFRQRCDGIAVIRRRPDLGPAANAAIAAALGVVDLGAGGFPSVQGVPIPRQSGLPPYLARLYPGIGFASLAGAGAVRVAVLIDDPLDPAVLPDPVLLREIFGLTPAEAAVAQLIPRLLARRAIAAHLGLSENTVKTHLATIRAKLGVRTTPEMIRILVRATLGPPR